MTSLSQRCASLAFAAIAAAGLLASTLPAAAEGPEYKNDPSWPKQLPNNWIIGQIGGMTVDAQDHIWVLQRPRSLTKDEAAAAQKPPVATCCVPAPPVMEFDSDGNFI